MKSTSHQFLEIRQETPNDYEEVFQLVKKSFSTEKYSDHKEHFLVQRLRKSSHFIAGLSLVALINNKLVGYVLLSIAGIKNGKEFHTTLALAPVAVLSEYQNQGVGSKLISHAHHRARELGYTSIVLIGHENYYPRFGYQLAHKFGISFPFDVPEINSFVKELKKNALKGISGEVIYAPEFFESES